MGIFSSYTNCCRCGVELIGLQKNNGRCDRCVRELFPVLFEQSDRNKKALDMFRKANGMAPGTQGMFTSYGPELAAFAEYVIEQQRHGAQGE
jgi:hypothetical protein